MRTADQHRPTPGPAAVRAAWDRVAPGFDAHVTPANLDSGERILRRHGAAEGTRLLDVAAGSGALAIPAARLGAEVVATDLSPAMIQRLAARAEGEGLAVDARVMDALSLDLADDAFDMTVSQHGVSLLPDMARGLREMARVTRPGGTVLVVAFGPLSEAEFLTFFVGALRQAVAGFTGLPTDPPPPPFQVADPARLAERMTGAGLGEVTVEPEAWDLRVRSATHLWDIVTSSNPIGAQLVADLDQAQAAAAREVLDGMLRERAGTDEEAVLHVSLNVGVGTA